MPPKNRLPDGNGGPSAPPSEDEGKRAADTLKTKKRRPREEVHAEKLASARKLVAEHDGPGSENAQLLSTTKAVVSAVPMSMNIMTEKLNQIYAVPLQDLAPEGVSFSMSKGELQLVGVTIEQILERVTPEWIEKHGVTLLVILMGVNIVLPRVTMMWKFWGHDHDKWMMRKAAFERGEDPDAKPPTAPDPA